MTPQNMMRYMILQYVSGKHGCIRPCGKQMLRPRTLVRVETVIIATFSQLLMVSVFHYVYKTRP